ncbi:histidine-rich glycoprotein [Sminthopsis crassicaudata]|uniref:histidine-rich glycoprotein n=1 Tax=Sminthopsis crassicaudata TaxID=9301 RepID=UPI003D680386
MRVPAILLLLLASAGPSFSLSPADCDVAVPKAEGILHLINEKRTEGFQFRLLRVADAHTDVHEENSAIIHYLVLDVIESDCSVLSRTHEEECREEGLRLVSELVIGKCKVVAITHPNTSCESELDELIEFNCTTSSASFALTNKRPGPTIIDDFEDPESYKEQAEKALAQYKQDHVSASSFQVVKVERALRVRGDERYILQVEFSIANYSAESEGPPFFFRRCPVFGFCRSVLLYNNENSDLNNPLEVTVKCEIFNAEDSRNVSSGRHHHRHHDYFDRCRHPPPGEGHLAHRPLGHGCRDHSCHHHSHEHTGPHPTHPSNLEEKEPKRRPQERLLSSSDNAPVRDEAELHHPQGTHSPGHVELPDDNSHEHHKPCSDDDGTCEHGHHGYGPHKHGPHGHGPQKHGHHGHGPHKHGPHGHGPHKHGHHDHGPHKHGPHGHGPHKHGPHGYGPHKHGPHGHGPHKHGPHGHGPHKHCPHGYGPLGHGPHRYRPPCHGPHRHGPPHDPSKEQDFHGDFPFHGTEVGSVYRLPPLKKGQVLPLPEISIPSQDHCPHSGKPHPSKPEIQPFPQTSSESCPGKFKIDYPQVFPFLEHKDSK